MLECALLIVTTALGRGAGDHPIAAAGPTAEEILAGADARIRQHRAAEVEVLLLDASGKPLPEGARVEIEQRRHEFLFGCNIFGLGKMRAPEASKVYATRFAELFNFATLPFYWWTYERVRGRPAYEDTEKILSFTKGHGITAKGHPLAWNYVDPPWLPEDPKITLELQLARVAACIERFRGQIDIWDVVNEAAHHDREEVRKQAPRLTRAIDEAPLGEYLRSAFRAARKANPAAVLLINDYRLDPVYESRVLAELVDEKGEPLYDAIGLQSHQHGGARPLAEIWEVCERFAKHGKPLHWTETTFLSGEEGWELRRTRPEFRWESTPEGEARQARDAVRFYTALFSHPAVEAITWCDFCDQGAWQSAPAGLLRRDMTPKPVYEELLQRVKGAWWTHETLTTGKGGAVRLRAFFGDHRVRAEASGEALEGRFTLKKGAGVTRVEVRLEARAKAGEKSAGAGTDTGAGTGAGAKTEEGAGAGVGDDAANGAGAGKTGSAQQKR